MNIISFMFKVIFGFLVIYLVLLLPNNMLWDRDNYLYYAEFSDKIIDSYHGLSDLIFNDYLFLKLNYFLSFFFQPEYIVNSFIIFSLGGLLFLIGKESVNFLTFLVGLFLIIMMIPILHLELIAIRQALATTLVLFSLCYLKDKKAIAIVFLVSSLIHSAIFLFFLLFVLDNFIFSKFSFKKRILLNAFTIFVIALSYLIVANFLGMRQAELYSSYDGAVGGGTFLLTIFIFIYLYFYGKAKLEYLYYFVLQGVLLFLIFYFFANSSVSARLLESVLPAFLILLVSKFRNKEVLIVSLILLAYLVVWFQGGQYVLFEVSDIQAKQYLWGLF